MQYVTLKKNQLSPLIESLAKKTTVVAPVAKGNQNFAFEKVTSAEEITLNYIPTILPPKKYFLPQKELLLKYDINDHSQSKCTIEYEKMILMGVHTCDLEAISCLHPVFGKEPQDDHYQIRRESILLIGYECNHPCDEHALCGLMETYQPNGGYDLFITDLGSEYLFHLNTQEGENLREKFHLLVSM